ncbi:MAG: AI-2E family transporter [Lachnospiraceae bacterium]|nr:AI-2E family transporter [Lachnospiraceae bacterium]
MGRSTLLQEKYIRLYKTAAVTVGVYFVFRYGLGLFAPFVAAYLLAGAVRPVVLFLKRKLHLPLRVGGVLVLSLLVGSLLTGVCFLGKLLTEQVMRLVGNYGEYKETVLDAAERVCNRVDGWFSLKSGTAGNLMYTGLSRVSQTVNEEVLPALSKQSLSILGSFAYGVAGVIIAIVAAVLLLGDGGTYTKGCRRSPFYEEVKQVTGRLSAAGVAYLKTQGILMTLVAVICTVGFLFVKREYALLLGISVAVLDAFPVLGSGLILAPWAVICLLKGSYVQTAVLVVMYVLCVLVREGLEPKLLGNRIGIPALYTLMAVYVGVELFGVWGVILGPFGLVVIRAVLDMPTGEANFTEDE